MSAKPDKDDGCAIGDIVMTDLKPITVADLRDYLAQFPQDAVVATIATCECCTELIPIDEPDKAVGMRDITHSLRTFGGKGMKKPLAHWIKPAVVIGLADWALGDFSGKDYTRESEREFYEQREQQS